MKAAENCSIEIIDLLLKKGADPFVKNKKGRTADQYAKQKQPDSGIELMIKEFMNSRLSKQMEKVNCLSKNNSLTSEESTF